MTCDAPTLAAAAVTLGGLSARSLLAAQTALLNTNPSGPAGTPDSLVNDARGFLRYSARAHMEVDTYLLAVLAGGSTDPETLLLSARVFGGFHHRLFEEAKTYSIALKGGGTTTAAGLEVSAQGYSGLDATLHPACQTYCLAVIAGGSTDPQILIDAAGAYSDVSTDDLETLQTYLLCSWSNVSACTDVPADLVPVITAHYTAGFASSLDIVFPKVCCDPGGYWIYGINSGGQLQQGIIPPANAGLPYTVLGVDVTGIADATGYFVRQYCADLSESGDSNQVDYEDTTVGAEWADRVEANGGARPSASSILAVSRFYQALFSAAILAKMKAVNVIAPDSLIAATTPLIVGPGLDPWTNANFVGGDITVNGLQGGATPYLDTGVVPSDDLDINDCGVTIWKESGTAATNTWQFGAANGAAQRVLMQTYETGIPGTRVNMWDSTIGRGQISTPPPEVQWSGMFSMNRIAAADFRLFIGRGGTPVYELGNGLVANTGTRPTLSCYVFAYNGGAPAGISAVRISFCAIHTALSLAQTTILYNAIMALRFAFGGGASAYEVCMDTLVGEVNGNPLNGSNVGTGFAGAWVNTNH